MNITDILELSFDEALRSVDIQSQCYTKSKRDYSKKMMLKGVEFMYSAIISNIASIYTPKTLLPESKKLKDFRSALESLITAIDNIK